MAARLSLSCERIILVCDEQTHQHSGGSINPDSESKASSPGGCKFTEWEQLLTYDKLEPPLSMKSSRDLTIILTISVLSISHMMGLLHCVAYSPQDISGRVF